MRLRPLEFSLCHRLSPKPRSTWNGSKTESSNQSVHDPEIDTLPEAL
ncbi:hypothetical protein NBRC3293_0163 [Gluconobacter oxydans NBRC 3293]|uniref:Uncharacterized protein n=1 Tax=Gluconobacter oxydans NBRC 3293 TaxID=1315969 RepID=A0A829X4Z1_GLUOY|nr:hypothetical protein NBRC3293_0163 [Gluconobacter oxydans NBRC 3293]